MGTLFGQAARFCAAATQITLRLVLQQHRVNAASSAPNVIGTTTTSTPNAANPRGLA